MSLGTDVEASTSLNRAATAGRSIEGPAVATAETRVSVTPGVSGRLG